MNLDEKYMRLALRLARRGMGKTSPNPMVGAVVVAGDRVVGRGYHHRAGEPHAEILALRQAGEKARGGTLYLNLEPCDHFGKTPPCTRAILAAGVRRVVAGMKDPNPLVSGRGIRRLRRAGIQAEVGILEEECRELNAPFRKFITTGCPWVILKAAATLDGKVAAASGDSRWISSPASRAYVHRLRLAADAVLVGLGTVLHDDPMLNVRLPGVRRPRHPLRVIVDSRLRIPMDSRVVRSAKEYPTLLATTREASVGRMAGLRSAGVTIVTVRSGENGRVSLASVMKELGRRGIQTVLLEGGPTLNASAIREKIVDRMLLFFAPKIIGGGNCPGVLGGEACLRVRDAQSWEILEVRRMGPDVMILAGRPGGARVKKHRPTATQA